MTYFSRGRSPVIPRPKIRAARTGSEVFRRYRKPLALVLLLIAVAAGINLLAQGQLAQRDVVVARIDLAAGAKLTADQVQLVRVPVDPADQQVLNDPQLIIGERLAVAIPAGTVLREHLLVGPNLLTGAQTGTVAVPMRLTDPATVTLIHPGQLVDIVLTTGDGFEAKISSRTIAHGLPVLWVPDDGAGQLGMFSSANTAGEGIIVVAAASEQSDQLAGAVSRGKVSAVLVN